MIVKQVPWTDVPDGDLIVGPSGRVWRCWRRLGPTGGPVVHLTDPERVEAEVSFPVDPFTLTSALVCSDPTSRAIAVLAAAFPHLEVVG